MPTRWKGKGNDKEVCGDAAAVNQRRSQALRRRAAAIQERLDKIKPVAKAPVSAAALAADRAEMQRVDGIAAKTNDTYNLPWPLPHSLVIK